MAGRLDDVEVANRRAPVIEPGYTFGTVTDKIRRIGEPRSDSSGLGAVAGGQVARAAAGVVGGQAAWVTKRYQ